MSKIALVTGGTRGIGAAISIALQGAGYTVAATYHGNDDAATAFKDKTAIRSEERRVGKEFRSRWSPDQGQTKVT